MILRANMKRKRADRLAKIIEGKDPDKLEIGDHVRISGGPYYRSKDGSKYPMGENGRYQIIKFVSNGFHAKSLECPGMPTPLVFIYTGPKYTSELGIVYKSHRVIKI